MTRDDVLDIINDSGYGLLATTEGTQPRVRPLAPYLTEDNELLVSLVPGSRAKQQAEANPLVELCYVDRKMQFCRIAGEAAISTDIEKKKIIWDNIPNLKQYFSGPEDANMTLMVIKIKHVEAMGPQDRQPTVIDL